MVPDDDLQMPSRLDTVLGKALAVLNAFSVDDRVLPLSELVRRTSLPKATVYRVAGDLVTHRLLTKDECGYSLSGALFELGMRASTERTILEVAVPFLQDLYERTHETVHLGVREGHEVVYVAKIGGHSQVRSPSRTGGRMPMHCTAIGKVLLAWADNGVRTQILSKPLERRTPRTVVAPGTLTRQLRRIVETGVAYEREESTPGLLCVAAPVFDSEAQRVIAAISISGPVGRFRPQAHADAVRARASALGSELALRNF